MATTSPLSATDAVSVIIDGTDNASRKVTQVRKQLDTLANSVVKTNGPLKQLSKQVNGLKIANGKQLAVPFSTLSKEAKASINPVDGTRKALQDLQKSAGRSLEQALANPFKTLGDTSQGAIGTLEKVGDSIINLVNDVDGLTRNDIATTFFGTFATVGQQFINDAEVPITDALRSLSEVAGPAGQGLAESFGLEFEDVTETLEEVTEQVETLTEETEKLTELDLEKVQKNLGEDLETSTQKSAGALTFLRNQFESLRNVDLEQVRANVGERLAQASERASAAFETVKTRANELRNVNLEELRENLGNRLEQATTKASEKLSEVRERAKQLRDVNLQEFRENVGERLENASERASAALETVKTRANELRTVRLEEFRKNVGDRLEQATANASNRLEEVKKQAVELREVKLDEFRQNLGERLETASQRAATAVETVKTRANELRTVRLENLRNAVGEGLEAASSRASKALEAIKQEAQDIRGINLDELRDSLGEKFEQATAAAGNAIAKVRQQAVELGQERFEGIQDFFSEGLTTFAARSSTALDGLKTRVQDLTGINLDELGAGAGESLDGLRSRAAGALDTVRARFNELRNVNLEDIQGAFGERFQQATDLAGKGLQFIKDQAADIRGVDLEEFQASLGEKLQSVTERSGKAIDGLRNRLNNLRETRLEEVGTALQNNLANVAQQAQLQVEALRNRLIQLKDTRLQELGTAIDNALSGALKRADEAVAALQARFEQLRTTKLEGLRKNIQEAVSTATEQASTTLQKLRENIENLGRSRFDQLQKGLTEALEKAPRRSLVAFARLERQIKKVTGIDTRQLRRDLGERLGQATAKASEFIGTASQKAQALGKTSLSALRNSLTGVVQSAQQTSASVFTINTQVQALNATDVNQGLGASFSRAAATINQKFGGTIDAIDRRVNRLYETIQSAGPTLQDRLNIISQGFGAFSGLAEPLTIFNQLKTGVGAISQGIFNITQQIAFFSIAMQSLRGLVVQGPFRLLIGQNVQLQEELLSTQSALAATSSVFNEFGKLDPGASVAALNRPVTQAIEQLRRGSLELVGVTSSQLVPLYQQVAQRITQIGGSLNDAVDLSLNFSAALGTLGLPLVQARQEIGSILAGVIDQNSVLAKTIGLSNSMVQEYIAQGKLIDKLNEKLSAFRAGNALAAQAITGVTSNIAEIIEEVGRVSGAQLLKPIQDRFAAIYDFLERNRVQITENVSALVTQLFTAIFKVADAFANVFAKLQGGLSKLPEFLVRALSLALTDFADALNFTITALSPLIDILAQILEVANPLVAPMLRLTILFKTFSVSVGILNGVFGTFIKTIPGVGELLFLLRIRNGEASRSFLGLRNEVGQGAAAFLLLGKNLQNIPLLLNILSKQAPILTGLLAGFVPQLSGIAIQIISFLKVAPGLRGFVQTIANSIPRFADALSPLVNKFLPELADEFAFTAVKASDFVEALASDDPATRIKVIENLTGASDKFKDVLQTAGRAAGAFALKVAAISAAVIVGIQFFDQFIQKNAAVRVVLDQVGKALQAVGKFIFDALNNPIVQAIVLLGVLNLIIKAQLIPSIITFAKTFVGVFRAEVLSQIGAIVTAFGAMAVSIQKTALATAIFAEVMIRKAVAAIAQFLISAGLAIKTFILMRIEAIKTAVAGIGSLAASLKGLTFASVISGLTGMIAAIKAAGVAFTASAFASGGKLLAGLSAGAAKAAAAFKALTGVAAASAAVVGLVIGAVGVLVEIFSIFARSADKGTRQTNEFRKEMEELDKTLAEFKSKNRLSDIYSEGADDAERFQKQAQKNTEEMNFFSRGLDVVRRSLGGLTEAETLVFKQREDTFRTLIKAGDKLSEFRNGLKAQTKLEEELAQLQNKRSSAALQGREREAKALDDSINSLKEQLEVQPKAIQQQIDFLKRLETTSTEEDKAVKGVIREYENMLKLFRDVNRTRITPPDLPVLNSALGDAADRLRRNLELLRLNKGELTQISAKAKETIALTQAAVERGTIDPVTAIQDLLGIATNSRLLAEQQAGLEAIQGIGSTVVKRQQRELEVQRKIVEAEIATGQISSLEGERKLTAFKQKQLQIQLNATRDKAKQEIEINNGVLKDLLDGQAKELQEKQKALLAGDITEKQFNEIQQENARKAQVAQEENAKRNLFLQQQLKQDETALLADAAKLRAEEEVRLLDKANERALKAAARATKDRQIVIGQLENQGLKTRAEANESRAQDSLNTIEYEIELERAKGEQLKKEYGEQSGLYRKSQDAIRDLTLKRINAEGAAQKALVDVIREQALRQAQAQANAQEEVNQKLREQKQTLDLLTRSLNVQGDLLNARKSILDSQTSAAVSQAQALSDISRSEREQKELAKTIAAIEFSNKQQTIALNREILEQEIEKNRAALEREEIENRLNIARQRATIAQGQAEIAAAEADPTVQPEQLEKLRLANIEQIRVLSELQGVTDILARKRDNLGEQELAKRLQAQQRETAERNQALVKLFQSLSPAEQGRSRAAFVAQILSGTQRQGVTPGIAANNIVAGGPRGARTTTQGSRVNVELDLPTGANLANFKADGRALFEQVFGQIVGSGPGARSRDPIFTADEGLEKLRGQVSDEDFNLAVRDSRRRFRRQFGDRPFGAAARINPQDNQQVQSVELQMRSAETFGSGVDRFTKAIDQLNNQFGGRPTLNISPGSIVINGVSDASSVEQGVYDGLTAVLHEANAIA